MTFAALWLWGTIAGLDLVSVLQSLFSRPLVVATGAGLLLGDVEAGLRVGALLELFALDVVPVGSSRYPDFGAATVAATLLAAGREWSSTLGIAAGVGLLFGIVAGSTLPVTRRLNARVVRAHAAALGAGDPRAVERVQLSCLGHDMLRSALVAAGAVALGWLVGATGWTPDPDLGRMLTVIAVAGAGWAVAHGAVASGRSGPRWKWAIAGVIAGLIGVIAE